MKTNFTPLGDEFLSTETDEREYWVVANANGLRLSRALKSAHYAHIWIKRNEYLYRIPPNSSKPQPIFKIQRVRQVMQREVESQDIVI